MRPAKLFCIYYRKNVHQGGFPMATSDFLTLLHKSHVSLVSGKTVGSAPQGHSFTKML